MKCCTYEITILFQPNNNCLFIIDDQLEVSLIEDNGSCKKTVLRNEQSNTKHK